MYFQIVDIEFDFDDNGSVLPYDEQVAVVQEVLDTDWYAVNEEDLVEEITCATGWCIKSINYQYVLK